MKAFLWFTAGTVFGVVALMGIQALKGPRAPFTDLNIGVAPAASAWLTPTPRAVTAATPTPGVIQVPSQRTVMRFENGRFTSTTALATSRPRAVQVAQPATRLAGPETVQSAPMSLAPATKPKGEEVSIFLDREQRINTRSRSYRIFVHDHGSETISVSVGYGPSAKVKKAFGSDSLGDNKVLIYADGNVQFFHVNTPRAAHNCCLIQVVTST